MYVYRYNSFFLCWKRVGLAGGGCPLRPLSCTRLKNVHILISNQAVGVLIVPSFISADKTRIPFSHGYPTDC